MAKNTETQDPMSSSSSSSFRKLLKRMSVSSSSTTVPPAQKDATATSTMDPENKQHTTDTDTDSPYSRAIGKQTFINPPRILVIGAGSRGNAYTRSALTTTNAVIAAVCEPVRFKRQAFGQKFIWGADGTEQPGQTFADWREWVSYEKERRVKEANGEGAGNKIDAVFVCVLDEMHEEVVCGIAEFRLHVCVEKPLSTRLESCVNIYRALKNANAGTTTTGEVNGEKKEKTPVFGICHVLRYSQHNLMLRDLVLEKDVIGDVMSIEHVEPVGWWHFSHSYVRGNWRKESKTAPSLLTKSCHDIDFLMWMLCSPPSNAAKTKPHLPAFITSTGSRKYFRKERKPKAAGAATNCLSCEYEPNCDYSAKNIYIRKHLDFGNTAWPVKIVNPEMEDMFKTKGKEAATKRLLENLAEDYTAETPVNEVEARPWFGRCVWEADNDVCDDQCVTITWEDDPIENDEDGRPILYGRGAKTAQFHMVAFTDKICERRGRIYGTKGEIEYDSETIKVLNFATGYTKVHKPHLSGGGHGGGDDGLIYQFLAAVNAVDSGECSTADAQAKYLGCDFEEAFRSHAMVFAAEEARTKRTVVDWEKWWNERVELELHGR